MAHIGADGIARDGIPDVYRLVVADGCEITAIGRPGHGIQAAAGIAMNKAEFATGDIPDLHRLIMAHGSNASAIGRPRHRVHFLCMAVIGVCSTIGEKERGQEITFAIFRRLPDLHRFIRAARCYPCAASRDRAVTMRPRGLYRNALNRRTGCARYSYPTPVPFYPGCQRRAVDYPVTMPGKSPYSHALARSSASCGRRHPRFGWCGHRWPMQRVAHQATRPPRLRDRYDRDISHYFCRCWYPTGVPSYRNQPWRYVCRWATMPGQVYGWYGRNR